MPSTSAAQHRLMMAALHNPAIAKKRGIPQSVARDFVEADRGKRFAEKRASQDSQASFTARALLERCVKVWG